MWQAKGDEANAFDAFRRTHLHLTHNRRLAESLRSRGEKALTLQSFVEGLYARLLQYDRDIPRPLKNEESLRLWRKVIDENPPQAFAEKNLHAHIDSIREAYQYTQDYLLSEEASRQSKQEGRWFLSLSWAYQKQLVRESRVDESGVMALVTEALPRLFKASPLYFPKRISYHIPQPTPAMKRFFKAFIDLAIPCENHLPLHLPIPSGHEVHTHILKTGHQLPFALSKAEGLLEKSGRVAIIVPNLQTKWHEVFSALQASGLPFNISLGERMSELPIIEVFLWLSSLVMKESLSKGVLWALSAHPFWKSPRGAEKNHIRKRLEAYDERPLTPLESARVLGLSLPKKPPHLQSLFVAVCEMGLLLPKEGEASEAITRFYQSALSANLDTSDFYFCESLRRLAAEPYQRIRIKDAPIQVLGLIEADGLVFDEAFILESDSLFPAPSPSPFLPYPLQRESRLPNATSEIQWERYSGLLKRIGAKTTRLHFLSKAPIPFVSLFEKAVLESSSSLPLRPKPPLETFHEMDLPLFLTKGVLKGGTNLIAQMAACPFLAQVNYRLAPSFESLLGPKSIELLRGIAVHRAMERLLESGVYPPKEGRRALIEAVLKETLNSEDSLLRTQYRAECSALSYLIDGFIEKVELAHNVRVIAREEKVYLPFPSLGELELRLDRVDEMMEMEVIIDYKTGAKTPDPLPAGRLSSDTPFHVRRLAVRPSAPQLWLYALSRENARGVLTFHLKEGVKNSVTGSMDKAFGTLFSKIEGVEIELLENYKESLFEARSRVEVLVERFVQGVSDIDPLTEKTCEKCEVSALCRFGEPPTA